MACVIFSFSHDFAICNMLKWLSLKESVRVLGIISFSVICRGLVLDTFF